MLEFLRQAIDRNYGLACEIYLLATPAAGIAKLFDLLTIIYVIFESSLVFIRK